MYILTSGELESSRFVVIAWGIDRKSPYKEGQKMNSRMIGYILLIVLGAVCAILSGWVYLLEPELRFLMFTLLGVLVMVAGFVRIVRERRAS